MLIPHSKPWITPADIEAVAAVLGSNMIGQGALTRGLEQRLATWVDGHDGVGVGSGSAALVLALNALEIGMGDEVILPTYVCPSVLEAVITVGAVPALCDVGDEWVITVESAARRLTPKTKAVIVPHMYGVFADIPAFRQLGIAVIEDCAQGLDRCGRRPLAADVAIFSFHPTKCLSSGEGGLAIAAESGLVMAMRELRDGIPSHIAKRLFSPLSDIAAGLALSQLNRYDDALDQRAQLAREYTVAIESKRPQCINQEAIKKSMFFRFPILLPGGIDVFASRFLDRGMLVRQGVDCLLHRLLGQPDVEFPNATRLFNTTVSLPIYPALTVAEKSRCVTHTLAIITNLH